MSLGQSTPNICTDNTAIYGQSFTLSPEWQTLTNKLGLINQQQTYLVWLWLDTAVRINFQRNTGNNNVGFIGNMAGEATKDIISRMALEFPMFTIASQLNISYAQNITGGQDCRHFYNSILMFPNEQTTNLCNDPSNTFNFVNNGTNY